MKIFRWNSKIDWATKIVDLLIVIIGITIAFKLNNWNELRKTNSEVKSYLKSFYDENKANHDKLVSGLKFLKSKKQRIDSLKQILSSKNYSNKRIKFLVASMTSTPDLSAATITMQSVTSSGKFDQIGNIKLRRDIISTYDTYKETKVLESTLSDYAKQYIIPFLIKNVRLINFSAIHSDFAKNPLFENYVIGYDVMLNQLINGYERNLKSVDQLTLELTAAERN